MSGNERVKIWRQRDKEREKEIYLENRRKGYKQKERQDETEVGRERKAERCWSKENESDRERERDRVRVIEGEREGIRENERVVRWKSVAKYFYDDFSGRMHYNET